MDIELVQNYVLHLVDIFCVSTSTFFQVVDYDIM